ncbi:4-phosphoerythronate dehydrogenase [Blochmannia endosymbiont of Polyrhachis (Hedomyrma) turneri]|uniref:4-phosphoerythronate dehydrogenase n=1 Tax=Blochmannia endosymbiont of Polyrhachis (Hedomyrma) turneri TaxID=1505596 RepID=UPI00061A5D05|nr:4-phosphoerythronate dehydrogenase [Blochmannia endosymbiont of Polyrhachis (Hedomyrma) turneri]AKC60060.1 erythronate-4-phosphate dehydrogenase [Blochmannia endosymbiont of Polyrhachis (Hedomyrma) turneri]
MKIVIDKNIPYAYELFNQFGDVQLLSGRDITCDSLRKADALIVRSITKVDDKLLLDTSVKFVGTVTSGVDHVDQDYLLNSSIAFASAAGCNAIAVSEYVFSALLWLAQRDCFFLCDKVIGIIGVGNIGNYLYKKLRFFGVSTLLCDPLLVKSSDNYSDFCSFEKVISESDILTFHVPLVVDGPYATWHMVNADVIESLSDIRVLVNTSRGSVFDNFALWEALKGGKKLSVILDVWENEPELLWPLLRFVDLGTPHIAGSTFEGKIRGIMQIFDAYKVFLGINNEYNNYIPSLFSITDYFEIYEDINQEILFCLSNFIYNITIDDIRLRCSIGQPNVFDQLRQEYISRREWSSICVKSSKSVFVERFKALGFNSICI